jgi:hypothetical protein
MLFPILTSALLSAWCAGRRTSGSGTWSSTLRKPTCTCPTPTSAGTRQQPRRQPPLKARVANHRQVGEKEIDKEDSG